MGQLPYGASVDVVIGTNPNVLQPYGYLTDDSGHNMLIYYSLGNFVTGQETLKQLLGGMAAFTIQKTVDGDQTSIQIQDATLTPLLCITATIPWNMHHISWTIIQTL